MRRSPITAALLLLSTPLLAPDMLPLKNGIFVPVGVACRGASNANMVNYWGGKTSLGTSSGECVIKKLSQNGSVFTISDICKDVQGHVVGGGRTVLRIKSPTLFTLDKTQFRYCGPKVQF